MVWDLGVPLCLSGPVCGGGGGELGYGVLSKYMYAYLSSPSRDCRGVIHVWGGTDLWARL